jgi:hypothetical protein
LPEYGEALAASCKFGQSQIEEIVAVEAPGRQLPKGLVREYLTRHIIFDLSADGQKAIELYLKNAAVFERTLVPGASLGVSLAGGISQ